MCTCILIYVYTLYVYIYVHQGREMELQSRKGRPSKGLLSINMCHQRSTKNVHTYYDVSLKVLGSSQDLLFRAHALQDLPLALKDNPRRFMRPPRLPMGPHQALLKQLYEMRRSPQTPARAAQSILFFHLRCQM